MSSTGTPPTANSLTAANMAHIPFPRTDTVTACRSEPELFAWEAGTPDTSRAAKDRRLQQARKSCTSCPIARGCLLWALANPSLTSTGIWAATTPRERTTLRRRLAARLGEQWPTLVATRDRERRQRLDAACYNPPSVRTGALVRLDREHNGPRPIWSRLLPPGRQAHNRERLTAGLVTTVA
ncbi:WhiB family transcriptional regulator [Streptomyces mauvecolor]|uniref:WhiB family transcriptional regulator n=1 Tax=Streptomyces mauvecolor TaxID=58345 RepID=A0ABV9UII0_9ACTN